MRLCLNMIVKNEAGRIERAILSAAPHIDCYAIVDTGSSDGTIPLIQKTFAALDIPGKVVNVDFHDFSQARNEALRAARALDLPWDYLLLMDADMELRVKSKNWLDGLTAPSYDMLQISGVLYYYNRRLLARSSVKEYKGVTHEYLDEATGGQIPPEKADFYDHADGANRPDKYKRDIALLKEGLRKEPTNERYFFYLAQSYRDAGKHKEAAKWYQRRIRAGGWEEEIWNSQLNLAHCYKDMKDEAMFVRELLGAYNMRPSRAESLYDLARYYREKGINAPASMFAEIGMGIPKPNDMLFVNDFVYAIGLKEEFAISSYYVPAKREKGFDVCNELSLKKTPYSGSRELARTNLYHYLPTITSFAPSFKWRKIDFEPEFGWNPLNPSVTVHNGELTAVLRTVNYKIDEHGRYCSLTPKGEWAYGEGAYWENNPIITRNFLLALDHDLNTLSSKEIFAPVDMPKPAWPLVLGFEDMRLFSAKGELFTSCTMREMNAEGYCEQVISWLKTDAKKKLRVANPRRMLRQPRLQEKNWMPLVEGDKISFMYRPGELCDECGQTYQKNDPDIDTGSLGGGTQLIPFASGFLGLVHEARIIPGKPTRYYSHRFVFYGHDKRLVRVSKPFVFHEKEIEYAAGLCLHPNANQEQLVISYGFKDQEARIATISRLDVDEWLWNGA